MIMSIYVTKRNGKIDTINIFGDEVEPLLSLLQTLANTSDLRQDNEHFKEGFKALGLIMRDYQ